MAATPTRRSPATAIRWLCLLALCAAYLQGGLVLVAWHDLARRQTT